MYNTQYTDNGMKVQSYVNNPKMMKKLINVMIFHIINQFINDDTEDVISSNKSISNLLLHLYEYIINQCKVNSILDEKIDNIIKNQRADENINRKKRFDKLNNEQKDVYRLMRKLKLGNMYDWDDEDKTAPEEGQQEELYTTEVEEQIVEEPVPDDGLFIDGGDIIVAGVGGDRDGVSALEADYGDGDGNDDEEL